jgi:hypothetical protein
VRQREEDTIESIEIARIWHGGEFEIRELRKVWMHRVDTFARVLVCGDKPQFNLRMKKQNAKEFASAVPRSS